MKIGLVLECIASGADELVCRHVIQLLNPTMEIEVAPLGKKPDLLQHCGESIAALLDRGCDRVIVVWDLYPSWRDQPPCLKEDRDAICVSLKSHIQEMDRVALVCIEKELETWLIADRQLLRNAFPRLKPNQFKANRRLEKIDPKNILSDYFRETSGRPYVGSQSQVMQLLKHLTDYTRIQRKCATFERFVTLLQAEKILDPCRNRGH